ncbi:manganese-dependent inorganic pyrophosphatase [Terrisporobacter vanillatitrophus]|uniref:manganese-dependent inorganic pyrophosphatase n=1 Tax=Terrisporobacter vanillatitrophus TaxID=3058402 RepID=UPI0033677B3E
MSLFVFGHKSPDTDSICSAISLAYLKNQLGVEAKAYALEEPRKEAKFVLDYFKVDAPEILPAGAIKGQDVALVDHNEIAQTADEIAEANLVEVIDHHKIGCLSTDLPISVRIMPVGCTCTIIYSLYKENNVEIPYEIAGLLLSAILSDTLIFKSPTTTEKDKEVALALAKIVNVDYEKYGMEMFKAGTSLDGFSIEEIVNMDFKEFDMSGKRVGIGQVMTLDIDAVLSKKEEFLAYINAAEFDMLVLAVTDIINEGSYLIYKGEDKVISEAFSVNATQGVFAEGVVSRKKQLVPKLTDAVKNI